MAYAYRWELGPYGETIAWSGSFAPTIGFTGHQMEPTGLIYMRGRFYSPAWHRFMNSDQGVDPNSLNQVAYVMGNPLMVTDPSGMRPDPRNPDEVGRTNSELCREAEVNSSAGNRSEALRNWERTGVDNVPDQRTEEGRATAAIDAAKRMDTLASSISHLNDMPESQQPSWWQETKRRFVQTNSVTGKPLISFTTNVLASLLGITGTTGTTGIPTVLQYANVLNKMATVGTGASLSAVGLTGLASFGQAAVVGTAGFLAYETGVAASSAAGGLGEVMGASDGSRTCFCGKRHGH